VLFDGLGQRVAVDGRDHAGADLAGLVVDKGHDRGLVGGAGLGDLLTGVVAVPVGGSAADPGRAPGEALPFWLYRIDYMHAATVRAGRYESVKPIGRKPSEYLRSNVWVTTSGMAWASAIMFCREVLGPDRVMYAMDYPYEYTPEEMTAQDALPADAAAKKAFFQDIAEQVFSLG
jgi:hypothetical protein